MSDRQRWCAVEAAQSAFLECLPDGWLGPMPEERRGVEAAVRAAAPHIRRAALTEAADDVGQLHNSLLPASTYHVRRWLRDRAARAVQP